ncbi:MAG: hypothetical protein FWH14_04115 [Oscillospiraceae bacterium]|nr:hypothetical protein [Oscillospiraceae bacterium]
MNRTIKTILINSLFFITAIYGVALLTSLFSMLLFRIICYFADVFFAAKLDTVLSTSSWFYLLIFVTWLIYLFLLYMATYAFARKRPIVQFLPSFGIASVIYAATGALHLAFSFTEHSNTVYEQAIDHQGMIEIFYLIPELTIPQIFTAFGEFVSFLMFIPNFAFIFFIQNPILAMTIPIAIGFAALSPPLIAHSREWKRKNEIYRDETTTTTIKEIEYHGKDNS